MIPTRLGARPTVECWSVGRPHHAMRQSDRFIKATWWLAVVAVAFYCLMSFFSWSLIDVVTVFAAPIL